MRKLNSCAGPKNGSLLIFGGGSIGFYKEFMELAGGPNSKIVVIPTAFHGDLKEDFLINFKNRFLRVGFKHVTILHTRNREEANTKEFVQPILEADGIWFSGGRHWRHADAYLNTLAHEAFNDVLDRGGVIAGGSAGASIQGSYLARADTKTNTIIVGDHEEGLGFLQNVAIDQHLLARNRQFDMFDILDKEPGILGLGIDEDTAIIVQKDEFRVIGRSYVIVYDDTRWCAESNQYVKLPEGCREFYFLRAGQEYDLKELKVVQFKDRKLHSFSKERLSRYVGKYINKETNSHYILSLKEKSMILQKSFSQHQSTLLQESDSRFFFKDSDFCLDFDLFKNGKIKGFHLLPRNTYWRRER